MKLNLQHFEELYKNATQGEWCNRDNRDIIAINDAFPGGCEMVAYGLSIRNIHFVASLANAFPSLLKTIRAYEEMVEKMRDMDATTLTCLCIEGAQAHKETDEFWRAKRESILNSLDDKLKEIDV